MNSAKGTTKKPRQRTIIARVAAACAIAAVALLAGCALGSESQSAKMNSISGASSVDGTVISDKPYLSNRNEQEAENSQITLQQYRSKQLDESEFEENAPVKESTVSMENDDKPESQRIGDMGERKYDSLENESSLLENETPVDEF